jgi:ABC-type uncharacterized transport system permease subunit
MQIMGGPFLWDGSSDWSPPSGQRAVNADPSSQGYTWPNAPVDLAASALATRIAALEARLTTEARGMKDWPAVGVMILGATSTQRVTLKAAMPNTGYTASAILTGPAAQSFAVASAVVVDKLNVDVTIKAGLAITLTSGQVKALVFADA